MSSSANAAGLLRRALPYAYQGALVAAALIALPPTGSVYESQAILELKLSAPAAGTPSPAQLVEEYALKLAAESGRAAEPTVGCAGGERRVTVVRLSERKLQLFCRADAPHIAQRQCDVLVAQIGGHFQAFEIAGRARAAVRSMTSRLIALAIGLGLGLGWVFLRVELRAASERRKAAGPRASQPSLRISSPRPMPPPFRRSQSELENMRTQPGSRSHSQPLAAARPAKSKQPLDRTMMGHGPMPTSSSAPATASGVVGMPAVNMDVAAAAAVGGGPRAQPVIDTTAEQLPSPASNGDFAQASRERSTRPGQAAGPSWRPAQDSTLAPYESTSRWSPDPAISASGTRAELRALCDQLYLLAAKGCFVIRVSSDQRSTQLKSHIAAQLAWSLADFGQARVLLLEADFDDPGVHRVMRLDTPPFKGFSQQMYSRMTSGERAPWSVARCAPCLSVLAEGRVRTPGLLHTAQFSTALAELRRHYDIIVVDGPPADSETDTRALDGVADGVVFAVTSGIGSSEGLKLASELFGDKSLLWIVHTNPNDGA
jgi:Mrp family chromosome partitioning ATPase